MPHVTFDEAYLSRRSSDETRAVTKVFEQKKSDDKGAVVRSRSRTISYKIPEAEKPSQQSVKPTDKGCIERRVTYKDSRGNIIKITYEDSCGHVTKTVYPNTQPPAPKTSPPSAQPKSVSPPVSDVSEPSDVPSEDLRNCDWTKIVVRNSRGVVWKIVHVDCDGKTMKTEYPEAEAPRRRSIETKRYVYPEKDDSPPRRRSSEVKKVVVEKESREAVSKTDAPKKRSVSTRRYVFAENDDNTPRRRSSEVKKLTVEKESREAPPEPEASSKRSILKKKYTFPEDDDSTPRRRSVETKETTVVEEPVDAALKRSGETFKVVRKYESRSKVNNGQESRRSEDHSDASRMQPRTTEPTTITRRRDSITSSIPDVEAPTESEREVVKDEDGVIRKVTYTDSRGRRRTVVYDE